MVSTVYSYSWDETCKWEWGESWIGQQPPGRLSCSYYTPNSRQSFSKYLQVPPTLQPLLQLWGHSDKQNRCLLFYGALRLVAGKTDNRPVSPWRGRLISLLSSNCWGTYQEWRVWKETSCKLFTVYRGASFIPILLTWHSQWRSWGLQEHLGAQGQRLRKVDGVAPRRLFSPLCSVTGLLYSNAILGRFAMTLESVQLFLR